MLVPVTVTNVCLKISDSLFPCKEEESLQIKWSNIWAVVAMTTEPVLTFELPLIVEYTKSEIISVL